MENKQYVLTKKIAKQGNQAVIVVPKLLQAALKPGTIVKVTLDVLGA
jgi:antitoxin component of MazEF toxin-antitoxin module